MLVRMRAALTIAGVLATEHRSVNPGEIVDVTADIGKRLIDAGVAEKFLGHQAPSKLDLPHVRQAPETKPLTGAPEVKDDGESDTPLVAEKLTPSHETVPVSVVETVPEDAEGPIAASPAADVREKLSETSDSRRVVNARRRAAQKD